ncbi:MAG: lipid-A-disaccharide synthase [Kiritimatiellaeota bacterium]|nr:lipid-A-disaccharide synthase [Kiritimatiellota bacterium]
MNRTVWIIAGETSGDAYGAGLACELRKLDPDITVRGMGGQAMAAVGVDILIDSTELGVVGLVEVMRHLPMFRRIFYDLLSRALRERPAAVVLIDYPGFNLRFARRLHKAGISVVYYVSPQVWAWGKRRIPKIARMVDKMLVIFPFEPGVYAGTGLDVEFVGHPLIGILAETRRAPVERCPDTVVLLPGSRTNELRRILPVMLGAVRLLRQRRPELNFAMPLPRPALVSQARATIQAFEERFGGELAIEVDCGNAREWLRRGAAGLAASGTVTVEAAILGLPLVVVYRVNWLTYQLARHLIDVPFITMVNLVCRRLVFEEFIQSQATPENAAAALEAILPDGPRRSEVETGMRDLVVALGGGGNASSRAAEALFQFLESGPDADDDRIVRLDAD